MRAPSTLVRDRIGRYRVIALIGAGANGLVYRVEDPSSQAHVALKVLREGVGDAADLKREFRLVADLAHPNLVLPYSLESDGREVFFTMELVHGSSIVAGLRGSAGEARDVRIRRALAQAADGLLAIHDRALVHRDVKPSNILLEASGRIAVLDFGLVRGYGVDSQPGGYREVVAGTPGYLAPEVLGGAPATPASDAYSLGVVLYEILTGRFPYHRDVRESVLRRMLERDAPAIVGAADDLGRLCRGLLQIEPRARMTLAELRAELAPRDGRLHARPATQPTVFPARLVGRAAALGRLTTACEESARSKKSKIVRIAGRSGMGKSALLAAFRREREAAGSTAWFLEGRACERDSVPFRALDGAMDALASLLGGLDPLERERLRPTRPQELRSLFPGVARALGVEDTADDVEPVDLVARREAAARALGEVLARIGERFGLVIMLDDVHWGDVDSARLLNEILAVTELSALIVLAYRTEVTSPFVELFERWGIDELPMETIAVEPLDPATALELATSLSGGDARDVDVARESEGCPFLIDLLSRAGEGPLAFEDALAARFETLSVAARQMLAATCVAARPIARESVPFTPVDVTEARACWASLINNRLLKTRVRATSPLSAQSDVEQVEAYHDRIRDGVVRGLSETDLRATHFALGRTFASVGDAEGAATHYAAAGDGNKALGYAVEAARAALATLAFDRGATLLALAIDCCADRALRRELALERAGALANGGRGAEAARVFLENVDGSTSGLDLDLRRRAMEQLFVAGRIEQGRAIMRELLRALEVWWPESEAIANVALYVEITRLLLRGPRLRARRALAARERRELDTFASIGKGLIAFDASVGSWFFLRSARRALDWGDPELATRGITYLASLLAFSGSRPFVSRARRWLACGEEIAADHGDAHALAFATVGRGMIACCVGEWRSAVAAFGQATAALEGRFAGTDWEANLAKGTSLYALLQLGSIDELETRATIFTQDARNRGDVALEVESNLYLAIVALARDSVDESRQCLLRNERLWPVRSYTFQNWIALRFRTLADLYAGAFTAARARLDRELPRARAANLMGMQLVRIEACDLSARVDLGIAETARGRARRRALRRAGRGVAQLEREDRPHARAPAHVLRAGIAMLSGDRQAAAVELRRGALEYARAEMTAHSLAAQWHAVRCESRPRAESEDVATALRALGIVDAARWAQMHLPVGGV